MAPSIVLRERRPRLVLGSAGSARLRGAILQVAANVVARGMSVEEAVEAPRIHAEGGVVHCEDGAAADALEARGPDGRALARAELYFGGVSAVEVRGRRRWLPRAIRAAAERAWSSRERRLHRAAGGSRRCGGADAAGGGGERRAGGVADLGERRVAQRRRRAAVPEGGAAVSECGGVRRGAQPTARSSGGCRWRATRIRRARMSPTSG